MFEPYNLYNPYGVYNPYYNNYNYNQPLQQTQQIPKQNQSVYKSQTPIGIQGKVVDSLDVVKATDIPYDGSISYFPLTDGSAIITKQLQQDGTSKVVIYKPEVINSNNQNQPKYVTENQLREQIKDINSKEIKDIKEEIKSLKRRLEDITDDIRYKKEK